MKNELIEKINLSLSAARKNPYFQKKYAHLPDRVESMDDFLSFPLLSKQELRDNYPYGLLCTDMSQVVEAHTSSGTTGKPAISLFTQKDIQVASESVAKAWKSFGIDENSRVMFAMAYGLFSGAMLNTYAIQKTGAFVLPAGILPSAKHLQLIIDFKIDTIVATPGYLSHLLAKTQESGIDPKSLPLKRAIAAGEVYSDNFRSCLETAFDIKIYDHYGLCEVYTGIAHECDERNGLHMLDDIVYAEIIDPTNGLPAEPGEEGELVLTSLAKEASPVIRYRTGDITKIIERKCACGRSSTRISRIQSRSDDMIFVKGLKINPHELKEIITTLDTVPLATKDIRIKIGKEGSIFRPKIILSMIDPQSSINELIKYLKEITSITFDIEHVEASFFDRETNMKNRIVEFV